MAIRPCERADLAAVAALARETFPGLSSAPAGDLATYFDEVFFESPWVDARIPSLVAEHAGAITGFLGNVPRPMRFDDRAVTAAVATSLMVRPAPSGRRDPIVAVQLLRRFLDGRQDLSLTDTANDATRQLWTGCGGAIAHPYSFWWLRPLRPFSTCAHFGARAASPWIGRLAKPLGAIADRLHALWPVGLPPPREATAVVEDLDPTTHLEAMRSLPGHRLTPCYDQTSLDWLMTMAARNIPDAALTRRLVRSDAGAILGWFVYTRPRQGVGCVLQYAAHPRSTEVVLDTLMSEAYRDGLAAVWGRAHPTHAALLTRRFCVFFGTPTVLAHAREPDILNAVLAGDMWMSGFEGELWMRGNAGR